MSDIVVVALYKFVSVDNFAELKKPLLQTMKQHQVKGTLLLAAEGINGTIAGYRKDINAVLNYLSVDPRFADLKIKESYEVEMPFHRSKVKLKQEIVTLGIAEIDPKHDAGIRIEPKDWNKLISRPDVLLIDMRNDYEIKIGTFKNSVNPQIKSFREFPQYVKENLDINKHKKIAMYCTGGIRCEKSTSYLKQQGFKHVYHLQGGILKYLAEITVDKSLWRGECFVFDGRVAVNFQLKRGKYDQCYACRHPITQEDKSNEKYQRGVSCPHCYNQATKLQRQRFQEREKQVQLAKQQGENHIGSIANDIALKRRELKYSHKNQQRKILLKQKENCCPT